MCLASSHRQNQKQKSLEPNQTSLSPESGAGLYKISSKDPQNITRKARQAGLSPGTYMEYGKEKEDPHRAGDEELPRIN